MGSVLYPLALGLGKFDPYGLGWGSTGFFAVTALVTIVLLWRENRFGILLFFSIAAYDLRCLESTNFWDYLVDPLYWLLSLCVLSVAGLSRVRRRAQGKIVQQACTPATVR